MRIQLLFISFLVFITTNGQVIKNLYPTIGESVDKSEEGFKAYNAELIRCEELFKKELEELTPEEKLIWDDCVVEKEGYWDVLGVGCSWYCGGGQDTNSASSALKDQGNNSYKANNIHDLSFETAWIEGIQGYGIGEYVTYHLPPENPRITDLIVVNGYVKSIKLWEQNSRVKTLKMYVNDQPYALLHLQDSRNEQYFKLENPLGAHNGFDSDSEYEQIAAQEWWTIRFEIIQVYKGSKYDDTAISEIYFDGIDVH